MSRQSSKTNPSKGNRTTRYSIKVKIILHNKGIGPTTKMLLTVWGRINVDIYSKNRTSGV